MDVYKLIQLLPIEVLIYKEKFQNDHIVFKSDAKCLITEEIKDTLKEYGLTYSFRQITMDDFTI